jgi:ribosome-associated protein
VDAHDPVTPGGIRLDPACLSWRFSRASGPGGQHVNTTASRVELRCDLDLAGLPPALHDRLVARFGSPLVRVVTSGERSQLRNRRVALDRLAARIDSAAEVAAPRRPTQPGAAQRAARLADKRHRSVLKAQRRYRGDD